MGEFTGISWTTHTFNPWHGCTKVSPGCDFCYAETLDNRWGGSHWGKGAPRKQMSDHYWNEPIRWNRIAKEAGRRDKVFCASMSDVMDDEAPEGARERLWKLIDQTPNLIWQLLTKRPQRYMRYLPKEFRHVNVWLGASAENQEMYDVRVPSLADASIDRGTIAFISYEPALGPINMNSWPEWSPDWLIFGGESGSGRRPMELLWATDIERQCRERGTKFFMKQMGARTPADGARLIPANLLIREFPEDIE